MGQSSETRLYLIRHGVTDDNQSGIFQGSRDVPLGELGRRQAECLCRRMRKERLDAVYTSPLLRARETAEILSREHPGIPVRILPGLRELYGGELEGHSSAENRKRYPREMWNLAQRPGLFQAPGGESTGQVLARARLTVEQIVAEHPGGTVAVVCHGFVLQVLLSWAEGVPLEEFRQHIVGNASLSVAQAGPGGGLTLLSKGEDDYIPEELRFNVAKSFFKSE